MAVAGENQQQGLDEPTGPGRQEPGLQPWTSWAVVGSDQPERRAWAPSRGSPQAAGGQSPGPAGWPAPRKAQGPQTWRQQQRRRKAVSDGEAPPGDSDPLPAQM